MKIVEVTPKKVSAKRDDDDGQYGQCYYNTDHIKSEVPTVHRNRTEQPHSQHHGSWNLKQSQEATYHHSIDLIVGKCPTNSIGFQKQK